MFATPGDDFAGDRNHDQTELSGAGRQGRLMRLAGWVDLDSRLSVGYTSDSLLPTTRYFRFDRAKDICSQRLLGQNLITFHNTSV